MSIFSTPVGPALTYDFIDRWVRKVKGTPDISMGESISATAKDIGISLTPEDLLGIADRLTELFREKEADGAKSPGGGLLLKDYTDWLENLDMDQRCLLAANWDYATAKIYYCSLDISIIEKIITMRYAEITRGQRALFEVFLYAQGGNLSGDDKPSQKGAEGDRVIDLRAGVSSAALAEIRALGF